MITISPTIQTAADLYSVVSPPAAGLAVGVIAGIVPRKAAINILVKLIKKF